jgi:chromosome segregation ATPase
MDDAEGPSDPRALLDAEGPADARAMEDAEGPSDPRALLDADGPAEARVMEDHHAMIPPGAELTGEVAKSQEQIETEAAEVAKKAEQSEYVESILNAKAPDEATPWALSVHLEQRIQKLQDEKSKVNAQLDSLEVSSKQLEKRLSSI